MNGYIVARSKASDCLAHNLTNKNHCIHDNLSRVEELNYLVFNQNGSYLEDHFESIFPKLSKDCKIFSSNDKKRLKYLCDKNELEYFCYFDDPLLNTYRIVAISEYVVARIILKSSYTINNNNILIIGRNDLSKMIAKKLLALGAHVSVLVCNELTAIKETLNGYEPVKEIDNNYNILINTSSNTSCLSENALKNLTKDTLLFDVTNLPYAIDLEIALKLGMITEIINPNLDIYAPVYCSEILADYIDKRVAKNEL